MKKTFKAKDLDIKITTKTSTLLSNLHYKYITNDVVFTYQIDDNNLIGNYKGIKNYLKGTSDDLQEEAAEMLKDLERLKNNYDLFKICLDPFGNACLMGAYV